MRPFFLLISLDSYRTIPILGKGIIMFKTFLDFGKKRTPKEAALFLLVHSGILYLVVSAVDFLTK
jgi:hypothetical protein